ncbi:addiction module toxin RelE [Thiohalocapsa halophila]|uniref:Addiction module toxin RelE n=1 Tax=Thiohalocapsa halophila TaxID=69359 RepID=A0ABS1CDH1_9GAMM|nr:transposase [Thiohalocapsa halophila]MBK1629939.1 addiction module toxin RelE [Thiohalocapsa halophila]
MARPLRLEFAGALHHVTARGNERRSIFLGDEDSDRAVFFDVLGATCERFNWLLHAYCLMTNHYHLLVETPDANLSKGMRQLNGVFTQTVNRTHARVGHLFQGRFKAILVERERYLLELCRYVVLNPVRARMVAAPGDWPWSSYRATVGETPAPGWLETDAVLRAFSEERQAAVSGYRRFVAAGIGAASPWQGLKGQIYLGSEQFVERMQARIDPKRPLREVPKRQRRAVAKPLAEYAAGCSDRDRAMADAYRSGAYSMQTIAEYFGVSRMTVSRAVKRDENVAVTCET